MHHFLTGEMSSRSKTLNKLQEKPCFYMNEKDAAALGIKDGNTIVVRSKVSSLRSVARLGRMPEGVIGCEFHSSKLLVNKLFPAEFDPESFTPNYKSVGVSVELHGLKNPTF